MRCPCGYVPASVDALMDLSAKAYAVIRNDRYEEFIRHAASHLDEPDRDKRFPLIAHEAAEFVGCLNQCPKCGRYRFIHPGAKRAEWLTVERVDAD